MIPTMQEIRKKGVGPEMTSRIRTIGIALIAMGAFLPLEAGAQTRSGTGLNPLLPIVPPAPGRELESDEDAFSNEKRGPLAELLESATNSDAILEVVVGQARILTLNEPIAKDGGIALVATGDPTVIDFEIAGPRLLRVLGRRVGVTDLSITTDAGKTYTFNIHVVYNLPLLTAYLQQVFPDASIDLKQLHEHIILQGQARSVEQIAQIEHTLKSYLFSAQVENQITGSQGSGSPGVPPNAPVEQPLPPSDEPGFTGPAQIDIPENQPRIRYQFAEAQIINLMRVPGVQQVMLKVQMAELNRTALRRIGADILIKDGDTILGSTIAGSDFFGVGLTDTTRGINSTVFGIFNNFDVTFILSALRQNGVVNILAEPNLMALNGQEASFLAGGEFPVPVAQDSGVAVGGITVEYKEFGVLLNFVPTILDDETIRLRVAPEVSNIDPSITVVVPGQPPFFGLSTRRTNTTVELKQGQTLALAGLLQVTLDANTARIPGLGDLPYIGPLFSNTSHQRTEKELLVMVTPYLVSPMEACQVPAAPGSEIMDPKDNEFFFLNRIEGRTGEPYRSTTAWEDPVGTRHLMHLEHRHCYGPVGYSE
jgi:pilus assembly protein CpaC